MPWSRRSASRARISRTNQVLMGGAPNQPFARRANSRCRRTMFHAMKEIAYHVQVFSGSSKNGKCEPWEPLDLVGFPLPLRLGTRPPFGMIGRGAEEEALALTWARAKDGQRQLVLVAGEPGIGKTRLATEAALAAHTEGAAVPRSCASIGCANGWRTRRPGETRCAAQSSRGCSHFASLSSSTKTIPTTRWRPPPAARSPSTCAMSRSL